MKTRIWARFTRVNEGETINKRGFGKLFKRFVINGNHTLDHPRLEAGLKKK